MVTVPEAGDELNCKYSDSLNEPPVHQAFY